ncbi:hypothetical protein GQ53DRAFT_743375 [Thozetella sp. PMI_491]|nr:hypothetical protein GQ53DRAFT_743375 [Thozetella sp. PMI_491]
MHSLRSLSLAGALLASQALAAFDTLTKPTDMEKVPAGSTYTVEWLLDDSFPTGPVTIKLAGGETVPGGLVFLDTPLVEHYDNSKGKYDWAVDKSLGAHKYYGIYVFLESNATVNSWGFPFSITGGESVSATSGTSSPPATTSSSSTQSVFDSSASDSPTSTSVIVKTSPKATSTGGSGGASNGTLSTPPVTTPSPSSTTSSPASKSSNFAGRAEATMGSVLGLVGLAALFI